MKALGRTLVVVIAVAVVAVALLLLNLDRIIRREVDTQATASLRGRAPARSGVDRPDDQAFHPRRSVPQFRP